MQSHKEILNQILANACGSLPQEAVKSNDGFQKFIVNVCCGNYEVEAKLTNDHAPFQYEVRSCVRK